VLLGRWGLLVLWGTAHRKTPFSVGRRPGKAAECLRCLFAPRSGGLCRACAGRWRTSAPLVLLGTFRPCGTHEGGLACVATHPPPGLWPCGGLLVAQAVQILVALLQAGEGALLADVLLHQQILGFAALLQGGEDFPPGQV